MGVHLLVGISGQKGSSNGFAPSSLPIGTLHVEVEDKETKTSLNCTVSGTLTLVITRHHNQSVGFSITRHDTL